MLLWKSFLPIRWTHPFILFVLSVLLWRSLSPLWFLILCMWTLSLPPPPRPFLDMFISRYLSLKFRNVITMSFDFIVSALGMPFQTRYSCPWKILIVMSSLSAFWLFLSEIALIQMLTLREQHFSSPRACSVCLTSDIVRKVHSQVAPQTFWVRNPRGGPSNLCFNSLPGWVRCKSSYRITVVDWSSNLLAPIFFYLFFFNIILYSFYCVFLSFYQE